MNLKHGILGLWALLIALPAIGQSWTSLKKKADEYAEVGAYWEAAENYYQAWKDKPNKLELAWKAGTYYGMVRDYARAAECLEPVANWNEPEKLCGLAYARALKQSGQWAKAIPAFESFIQAYGAADRPALEAIVEREIAGCQEAQNPGPDAGEYRVQYAGKAVNSDAPDFAPAPFGTDVVYFSSTRDGKSRIFRSLLKDGKWGKADIPSTLPANESKHIANGSFTPDGNRFYYTVCEQNMDKNKLTTRCEIYVMTKRSSGGWNTGTRLPDYINLQGNNQTHPSSVILNGTEYLFFSSDRAGGEGGMDIWYCRRDASGSAMDYSLPESVGEVINTTGDEVTPFYDATRGQLAFSSNGHITLGGQDIYFIQGIPGEWGALAHPGQPLNSPAEDMYFRLNADGTFGFLSSNRLSPGTKANTRDEDLFVVSSERLDHVVRGQLYDAASQMPLADARVNIYHIANGEKVMFNSTHASDGKYEFVVPDELDAWVLAEKFEYEPSSYHIDYHEARGNTITHDFYLKAEVMPDEALAEEASTLLRPEETLVTPSPETPSAKVKESPEPVTTPAMVTEDLAAAEPTGDTNETSTSSQQKSIEPKPGVVSERSDEAILPNQGSEPSNAHQTIPDEETMIVDNPSGKPERLGETPVKSPPTKPAQPAPAAEPMFPESRSGEEAVTASAELFTGQGLDMRYNGKRVDKRKYESETQAYPGICYRVQLEATDHVDLGHPRYGAFTGSATLETETLSGIGLTRILAGVWFSESDALSALRTARESGFDEAYIVRYEDGVRLRRWR